MCLCDVYEKSWFSPSLCGSQGLNSGGVTGAFTHLTTVVANVSPSLRILLHPEC